MRPSVAVVLGRSKGVGIGPTGTSIRDGPSWARRYRLPTAIEPNVNGQQKGVSTSAVAPAAPPRYNVDINRPARWRAAPRRRRRQYADYP